jgi:hypothetical protein
MTGSIVLRAGLIVALCTGAAYAQDLPLTQVLVPSKVTPLDPTRDLAQPVLESAIHKPLPEEYIAAGTEGSSSQHEQEPQQALHEASLTWQDRRNRLHSYLTDYAADCNFGEVQLQTRLCYLRVDRPGFVGDRAPDNSAGYAGCRNQALNGDEKRLPQGMINQ